MDIMTILVAGFCIVVIAVASVAAYRH